MIPFRFSRILNKGVFILSLSLFTPLVSHARLAVMPDLEGSWPKVIEFIKNGTISAKKSGLPPVLTLSQDGKGVLADDARLVFLGDVIDKGKENIKVLEFILNLKRQYGDRVILILANRDINKFRFNWELMDDSALNMDVANASPSTYRLGEWIKFFQDFQKEDQFPDGKAPVLSQSKVDGVYTTYHHGKNKAHVTNDRILKMKFLFAKTLGCPTTFNDFKEELASRTGGNVSDETVFNEYMALLDKEDGLLVEYAKSSSLIYLDEETHTLFVHGGITSDSLGYVPETSKNKRDSKEIADVRAWIVALNTWAQDRVDAAINGDRDGALPIIEYQEPKVEIHPETKLSGWSIESNPISVIHGRPWEKDTFALLPVDPAVQEVLLAQGISRLAFGHSPVGQVPVHLSSESGFETIACDTSVTSPPRVGYVEITKDFVTMESTYAVQNSEKQWVSTQVSFTSVDSELAKTASTHPGFSGLGRDASGKILLGKWGKSPFGPFGAPEYSWVDQSSL